MLNTKENFNQLDATLAVNEIDNEAAATIQGGADLIIYRDYGDKSTWLGQFNTKSPYELSKTANDAISGVIINKGTWKFFKNAGFEAKNGPYDSFTLNAKPGEWQAIPKDFNDKISSFRKLP